MKDLELNVLHVLISIVLGMYITFHAAGHTKFIHPYLTLLGGDRESTVKLWEQTAQVNRKIIYPASHVPEIQAADYSFEALQEATDNFRNPAVVRGLFRETKAVSDWSSREYLPEALAGCDIPVVNDGTLGTLQNDRRVASFGDAYTEVFDSDHTKTYLFFPVKSRFTFNGSEAGAADALQKRVNEVVVADLGLAVLKDGFAGDTDKKFAGAQFVIGKSNPGVTGEFTGSNWHCAPGSNFFVQVVGTKRWEFISPHYSAYLWPLKGGLANMWTANPNIAEDQKHIPTSFVDIHPGDMIYNPDWAWHKITNFPGFNIGVPVRYFDIGLTMRNNPYFFVVITIGKLLAKVGLSLGGYPDAISAATEHDN